MGRRRKFTAEFKTRVVLEVLVGASTTGQACQKYRLNQQVISRWKADFLERAPQVFDGDGQRQADQERIAELERMVGRLTMEVEILKKVSHLLGSVGLSNGR
jgi:transposase-like protein